MAGDARAFTKSIQDTRDSDPIRHPANYAQRFEPFLPRLCQAAGSGLLPAQALDIRCAAGEYLRRRCFAPSLGQSSPAGLVCGVKGDRFLGAWSKVNYFGW